MGKLTLTAGICVIIASLGLPALGSPPGNFCKGKKNGYYPCDYDQYSYYSCVDEKTKMQSCPPGMVYRRYKKACERPGQYTRPKGNFCKRRNNGDYPNPKDKYTYISCVAGLTYIRPCPSGLVYSRYIRVCVRPAQTNPFCKRKGDGNYRNPNDKHSFISCVARLTYIMQCPAGLVYKQSKNRCLNPRKPQAPWKPKGFCHGRRNGRYPCDYDKHSYYSCVDGKTKKQSCPPGMVYRQSKKACVRHGQNPPKGNFCWGRKNGDYPNPKDKYTYISCVAGLTYVRPCPPGLVYSRKIRVCVRPAQTNPFCKRKTDGNYRNPNDKHSFISCVASLTYIMPCPAGLVYKQSKNRCLNPGKPQAPWKPKGFCHGRRNGRYPCDYDKHSYYSCVDGKTKVQTCPPGMVYRRSKKDCVRHGQIPPKGNFCWGRKNGDFPNPKDKYTYISCVAGLTYVRPCPPGLVYSRKIRVCVRPAQTNPFCKRKTDGNYRNPNDKHSFISCVASLTYIMPCPAGLVYKQSKNRCLNPGKPQAPWKPKGFCHGRRNGRYPCDYDKHSYYSCVDGKTKIQTCPPGLVYRRSKKDCVRHDQIPPKGNFCWGRKDGDYPCHYDERSYYSCADGKTKIQSCPPGLVFRRSKRACDYPGQAPPTGNLCPKKP